MAYTEYYTAATYRQLDPLDQSHFNQLGIILPQDLDARGFRYKSHCYKYFHPGSGIQEFGKDRIKFEKILDADAYFLDYIGGDKVYLLVSMDYGVVTIEHFAENYLLKVDPEYRERILKQFEKHGLSLEIVGDNQYINVWKRKNNTKD